MAIRIRTRRCVRVTFGILCLQVIALFVAYSMDIRLYGSELPKPISMSRIVVTDNTTASEESVYTKPMIAICAPTRSLHNWTTVLDSSLQSLLIPSILRTVTPAELDTYRVFLYLGINHDDAFWIKHVRKLTTSDWLEIHTGFYNMAPNRVPFNEVTDAAYMDAAEYIVRINDDTEFVTGAWITAGVQALAEYDPPNVGVVGPTCNASIQAILTHDMVHRTHRDIFPHYYPPVFDNWYVDNWITEVYKPNRTRTLAAWRVVHHTQKHGMRYTVDWRLHHHLTGEIENGKRMINMFVQHHR